MHQWIVLKNSIKIYIKIYIKTAAVNLVKSSCICYTNLPFGPR